MREKGYVTIIDTMDFESGGWIFGHDNEETSCQWNANYGYGYCSSPPESIRLGVSNGGEDTIDSDRAWAYKDFSFQGNMLRMSVKYQVGLQTDSSESMMVHLHIQMLLSMRMKVKIF